RKRRVYRNEFRHDHSHLQSGRKLPHAPQAPAVPKVERSSEFPEARKEKPPTLRLGVLDKNPGDDLLSHADAHYHRRVCVSLPSSEWDRVVPQSYCHQGDRGGSPAPVTD